MNKLKTEKQKLVLSQLTEGNSIRSIQRITGVDQNTVMRLLVRAGMKSQEILDKEIRNVPCRFLELDEIWTFVGIKQGHIPPEERDVERGDQYVFVALDADTKLVPCFLVGKRNADTTDLFLSLLRKRIHTKRLQISTDRYAPYQYLVKEQFWTADFGQILKVYGPEFKGEKRYSPPQVQRMEKHILSGFPIEDRISTSFVERQNLTMRMQMRRFTRLTNAFSKKLENLVAAVALHFYQYNFMRVHSTLGMTPAMAAGLTNEVWGWDAVL